MATKTIKITKGTEYKFKIEAAHEFADSLMSDVYNDAAGCTLDIFEGHLKKDDSKSDQDYYNNIIAFVGDRGTGKSSAMLSFANALENGLPDKYKDKDGNEQEFTGYLKKLQEEQKKYKIKALPVIDPSLLEKNDSILEIIVSSLFSNFEEKIKKADDKEPQSFDSRKKLLTKFQEVQEVLKTIQTRDEKKSDLYNGHTIECLGKLSASTNLKVSFRELVEEYLKFMTGNDKKEQNYLLIKVDDLDLNFKYAYNMVEQIRKYLIIPQVIVLMGVKLDQLEDIVEQNFIEEFKEKLGCVVTEYRTLHEDPKDMTIRYLEKLIPEKRRLNMPDLNILQFNIEIKIDDKTIVENNFQDAILLDIYNKTGMIFIKNDNELHRLIPRNLRELINFLMMLYNDMTIVDKDQDHYKNFERLEDYFKNHWIRNNINVFAQKFIKTLLMSDVGTWNKAVVTYLHDYVHNYYSFTDDTSVNNIRNRFSNESNSNEIDEDEIKEYLAIVNKENNSQNISIGDVLFVFQKIGAFNNNNENIIDTIFALKTIYSLKLRKEIYNQNYNNVQAILGGSIRNFEQFQLIKRNQSKIINKDKFSGRRDIVIDIKDSWKNDYLYYFVSHLGASDNKVRKHYTYPESYRKNREIYYKKDSDGIQIASFDIMSCIFFSINPESVINRFATLDEISKKAYNPIHTRMIDWQKKYVCMLPIYSIEFIDDLLNTLELDNSKNCRGLLAMIVFYLKSKKIKQFGLTDNFIQCPLYKEFDEYKQLIDDITEKPIVSNSMKPKSPLDILADEIKKLEKYMRRFSDTKHPQDKIGYIITTIKSHNFSVKFINELEKIYKKTTDLKKDYESNKSNILSFIDVMKTHLALLIKENKSNA